MPERSYLPDHKSRFFFIHPLKNGEVTLYTCTMLNKFHTSTLLKNEDLAGVSHYMQHCLRLGKYSNLVLINFTFTTLKIEVD